jgi:hypothetical protein
MGSAGLCPPAGSAAHQHASTWSASPGASGPDGIHYDVKGNLWAQLGGLGGIVDGQVRSLLDKRVGAAVTVVLDIGALRAVKSLSISSRIAFS